MYYTYSAMAHLGYITVSTGCMFAGKTSSILDDCKTMSDDTYVIFRPLIDTRSTNNCIESHDHRKHEAVSIRDVSDMDRYLQLHSNVVKVYIDEAQFVHGLAPFIEKNLSRAEWFVAGLDYTSSLTPFGDVLKLSELANETIKHTCQCRGPTMLGTLTDECTRDALYTYRKSSNTSTILIGGSESYIPVCLTCHTEACRYNH